MDNEKLISVFIEAIHSLEETFSRKLDENTSAIKGLTSRVDHLTGRVDHLTERVDNNTEAIKTLTNRVDNNTEAIKVLAKATDEKFASVHKNLTQQQESLDGLTFEVQRLRADVKEMYSQQILKLEDRI